MPFKNIKNTILVFLIVNNKNAVKFAKAKNQS